MASMSDEQLTSTLSAAVAVINPVIDTLAERDPFGIKDHTFSDPRRSCALEALGSAVNITRWPGTEGWQNLSMNDRADWWVSRVGAINTLAVAYPGVFGAWTRMLPLTAVLGFANQAVVIVAVAREYGVNAPTDHVALLAAVLCGRDMGATPAASGASPIADPLPTGSDRRSSLIGSMWRIGKTLRALNDEIGNRPGPNRFFRTVAYIPIVGAPALYLGERGALSRAAKQARSWIVEHREAIDSPAP